MPNNTNRLGLPYILQSQSQKEVTHNDGLNLLDALVQAVVQNASLNTPPASPTLGNCYIVGGSPTGAWVGHSKKIAQAIIGGWLFIPPFAGLSAYNTADSNVYRYDGTNWLSTAISSLQNLSMIGINASADANNKLAVASSAILFNHIGNGVQVKLNKNAAGDSASFLFQSNWSGRAEIGNTGDDDFHFKVSPNGSTWYEGIILDRNNGRLKSLGISFDSGSNYLTYYRAPTAFTPTMFGETTAGTPTYTKRVGRYTRIGNIVHCWIDITISNKGGMVGDLLIDGLPFTSNSAISNYAGVIIEAYNYTLSSGHNIQFRLSGANSGGRLQKSSATGTQNLNASEISNTFTFSLFITYFV